MAEIPNLAGVATKDLVEQIGGSFKADYINWSRTLNLLRTHAPGWMAMCLPAEDGSLLHKAPVGAYLLIAFRHVDGTITPAVPQAVMDSRNNALAFDKITARDITDTQRRGTCLAAAFTFGLAYELWAKMPLEAGYTNQMPADAPAEVKKEVVAVPAPNESDFRELGLEKGLSTHAVDKMAELVKGDWAKGIQTLKRKTEKQIYELNTKYDPKTAEAAW